jgi:hypothetical protein
MAGIQSPASILAVLAQVATCLDLEDTRITKRTHLYYFSESSEAAPCASYFSSIAPPVSLPRSFDNFQKYKESERHNLISPGLLQSIQQ